MSEALRKMLWSLAIGGVSVLAVAQRRLWNAAVDRNLLRIRRVLEGYSDFRPGEFAPEILRAGNYRVCRMTAQEYFLYGPHGGRITVNCGCLKHPIILRWFNPRTGRFYRNDIALWDRDLTLKPPFEGDAAIFLKAG